MTIFLSQSLPQQPAFLYATYSPAASIVASSSAAGYSAADLLQPDENNGWKPAGLAQVSVTVDLGAPMLTDYFAAVGNDFASAKADVFGSEDNVSFVQISPFLPLSSNGANGECWRRYSTTQYRYLKLLISYHSTAFRLKHLVFGLLSPLPFIEDGFCTAPLQAEGEHLISHAGLYLGSTTSRVMRPFSLSFGQVTPVEEVAFAALANACVRTPQGCFFVPDISQPACHFGVIDRKWKYEPVMKNGLYTIPKIPFTARAA